MPLAGPTGAVDLQLAALAQLAAGGVLRCILVRDTPWMISSSYLAHFSSFILLIVISNYYFSAIDVLHYQLVIICLPVCLYCLYVS